MHNEEFELLSAKRKRLALAVADGQTGGQEELETIEARLAEIERERERQALVQEARREQVQAQAKEQAVQEQASRDKRLRKLARKHLRLAEEVDRHIEGLVLKTSEAIGTLNEMQDIARESGHELSAWTIRNRLIDWLHAKQNVLSPPDYRYDGQLAKRNLADVQKEFLGELAGGTNS